MNKIYLSKSKQIIISIFGFFFLFGAVTPAFAATSAELQAQLTALLTQVAALQAQLGTTGGSAQGSAVQFNTNLTVGSTGADVTALQQFLVSKGFLQMPAGVSYGYFGSLTKSAVAAWQRAIGVTPALGYFGPDSRAMLNSQNNTQNTPITPVNNINTNSQSFGVNTPGEEGILTVSSYSSGNAYVRENDKKATLLGLNLEAKFSDIRIGRVKIDFPNNYFYNRVINKIYLIDQSGNVLSSMNLNSDTVTKESSTLYSVVLSGFNYVVPKDSTVTVYIKADVFPTVSQVFQTAYSFYIPSSGVRGVDGAGVSLYGPTGSISQTFNVTGSTLY